MNLFDKILDLIALPIRKLWRVAAHGTPQEQFRVIFTIAVLMVVLSYFTVTDYIFFIGYDERTFLMAANSLSFGDVDIYRTPVYPLLCRICIILGGEYYLWLIGLSQIAIFLLSVVAMHKASCILAPQRPFIRFIAEACYSCNSAVCLWVFNILAESLSISCVVFLAYLLIKLLKNQGSAWLGFGVSVLYLIMLFLKPYFICFAPVVLIAMAMAWRKASASTRWAFVLGIMLNVGTYTLYCHQFEKKFGIFATTGIGVQNMVFHIGSFQKVIEHNTNPAPELGHSWIAAESIKPVKEYCISTIKNKPILYAKILTAQFVTAGKSPIPSHKWDEEKYTTIYPQLPLRLWEFLLILFIFRHLWRWRKRNANVQTHAILALLVISGVFTAIAGSGFGDYPRLLMPVYPILCLIIAAPGNFREEE